MSHRYLFPFILLVLGLFLIGAGAIVRIMHAPGAMYFFWGGLASLLFSVILFVVLKLRED